MKVLLELILLVGIQRSYCSPASCTGYIPFPKVAPSAAGRWYLVNATQIGNSSEDRNTCGFFNTVAPCKCIGVNINSTMLPPNIQNYTLQNFGYNEKFNSYGLTQIQLSSISNNTAVFSAFVTLAKINFTIAMLGTDDYLSWIALAMCDVLKDSTGVEMRLKWIITRSPLPTENTISNAIEALNLASNSTSGDVIAVNQLNCPPSL